MTYERAAIEALGRCRFVPATFDKRFALKLAASPETFLPTPKQREVLYKLVIKYRRQMPKMAVDHAKWWQSQNQEEVAFWNAIEATPDDAAPRLIYADWLDDRGRDADASAQRFMVEHSEFPTLKPCGVSYGPDGDKPINYEWSIGMKLFNLLAINYDHPAYWHPTRQRAEAEISQWLGNVRAGRKVR